MIRQINVKEPFQGPSTSAGGLAAAEELSVTYRSPDPIPLFQDFNIRPGLLMTVSDREKSPGSKTVHETGNAPISLGFNLGHRVRCTVNAGGKGAATFERSPGDFVLSYLPRTRCIIETPPEDRILGVSIHFSRDTFINLFQEVPPYLDAIFSGGSASQGLYRQSRFSSGTASILNQIIACPYAGEIRRLFLEAKALELVALSMASLEEGIDPSALSRREEEQVREAYAILSARIDAPPTLCDLSRETGINRNKLNQGFRHLYGDTVFNVLRDLRLFRARDLILNSEKSLVDIALSVGYGNQANFTTAFRRKFGKTPLVARREGHVQTT